MNLPFGAIASGLLVAFLVPAAAQVPPHRPGTICFTAYSWCWLNPAQRVGSPCICPSIKGTVNGQAG